MHDAATGLGLTHLATGAILILVAIPLIRRRVKMNPLYGVRIAQAFESDAHWYAINAYGGRMLVYAGAALVLAGAATLIWHPDSVPAVLSVAFAPLPVLAIALARIFRFARRLNLGTAASPRGPSIRPY